MGVEFGDSIILFAEIFQVCEKDFLKIQSPKTSAVLLLPVLYIPQVSNRLDQEVQFYGPLNRVSPGILQYFLEGGEIKTLQVVSKAKTMPEAAFIGQIFPKEEPATIPPEPLQNPVISEETQTKEQAKQNKNQTKESLL